MLPVGVLSGRPNKILHVCQVGTLLTIPPSLCVCKNLTCYVHPPPPHTHTLSDLVTGLIALMGSNYSLPVNLGNPEEHTITEFAQIILDMLGT